MTAPFAPINPHEEQVLARRARSQGQSYQGVGMALSTPTMRTGGDTRVGLARGGGFPNLLKYVALPLKEMTRGAHAIGDVKQTLENAWSGFKDDFKDATGGKLKKVRKAKTHGSGFISDALGAIGLGLPLKFKDGPIHKLTAPRARKLHKHVTKAFGGSFADSFIRGLISPFSAVAKLASYIPVLGKAVGPIANILPNAVTALTGIKPLI